ncbi:MAG: hypothetical protein AAFY88_12790 [Acidobacteriota bacterium]
MYRRLIRAAVGLALGMLVGAVLGSLIGVLCVELFDVTDFEGYSGYLVGYCFLPTGSLLLGISAAALAFHSRIFPNFLPVEGDDKNTAGSP